MPTHRYINYILLTILQIKLSLISFQDVLNIILIFLCQSFLDLFLLISVNTQVSFYIVLTMISKHDSIFFNNYKKFYKFIHAKCPLVLAIDSACKSGNLD